jgi:formate-dependent nitrite reductase membrane component NrfD
VTEIDVTGINPIDHPELATWEWPVALYLFVGGLVGGLMILAAIWRLRGRSTWTRAIRIVDLWGLPLLALGLFLLFLDLSYKVHAWRFYLAFRPTSAMSWGAWILLVAGVILGLRASIHLPATKWFTTERGPAWVRRPVAAVGSAMGRHTRPLDISSIVVGTALALYTGILLSTIPARPLWDSALLAPLFLVSGVAAAGAFACLFLSPDAHRRMTPFAMGLCAVELVLIGAFLASLIVGTPATREAVEALVSWPYGALFWGGVVVLGLLVPFTIEAVELSRGSVPHLLGRAAPTLKLLGSAGLRFVIVLAGLQTVM